MAEEAAEDSEAAVVVVVAALEAASNRDPRLKLSKLQHSHTPAKEILLLWLTDSVFLF